MDNGMYDDKIKIRLNNIDNVKKFVSIANSFQSDIDVFSNAFMNMIDGKSILGVLSLDISKNMYVRIISNDENEIKRFEEEMEEFKI